MDLFKAGTAILSAITRWLPTSIFAAVFLGACLVGLTNYLFILPQLERLIADGITTKAQIANLRPSLGRGSTPTVDLTWEGSGKFCRLSGHSISNQTFTDIERSLASTVDQISVLVDPTGACRAVIVADIPFERKQRGLIPIVAALVIAGLGTVIGALAASRF
ncbi:hypothetical protein [Hyphomicrobium sp. NDB2Meth4]|uniref:hypothetical protein n=1 Tax=Hyphomicrobium sp. NDB2Meth4 TaxID=1892846 RepID=UPI0011149BCF|nr:hypothetical protein [Hyphomicrobium sp. NDB2Meth4]